jgi:hypothetical protein
MGLCLLALKRPMEARVALDEGILLFGRCDRSCV